MSSKQPKTLGELLHRLRKEEGLTQEQLAAGGDFHQSVVSLCENGERTPTLAQALAMWTYLSPKHGAWFWGEVRRLHTPHLDRAAKRHKRGRR
ncbi:MAG: helix-turn-helix transcriptional regulator [Planctomycetota bacterium]|jgi:predicted transcriptional regulator|nr:helix-turn-helix transcriptional regulator [Planctomycetota bacterium]